MYPDHMAFRPERFIGVPDAKAGGPRDPNTIAFGWVSLASMKCKYSMANISP